MSEPRPLRCVEIEPAERARAAVIWLHGLGADGHDFEPIVPELALEPDLAVRFVFPHAPAIPVTINAGMVMPAWYDISDLGPRGRHDEAGILRSAGAVELLIAREVTRGIDPERIVLAGFSQGGAIAIHVALRHAARLAGLVALSTYLVRGDSIEAERSDANRGLAVFQAHGAHDPMVPHERGVALRARLLELGHPVTWRSYPMGHQVCLEEIGEIGAFLTARLAR